MTHLACKHFQITSKTNNHNFSQIDCWQNNLSDLLAMPPVYLNAALSYLQENEDIILFPCQTVNSALFKEDNSLFFGNRKDFFWKVISKKPTANHILVPLYENTLYSIFIGDLEKNSITLFSTNNENDNLTISQNEIFSLLQTYTQKIEKNIVYFPNANTLPIWSSGYWIIKLVEEYLVEQNNIIFFEEPTEDHILQHYFSSDICDYLIASLENKQNVSHLKSSNISIPEAIQMVQLSLSYEDGNDKYPFIFPLLFLHMIANGKVKEFLDSLKKAKLKDDYQSRFFQLFSKHPSAKKLLKRIF